MQPDMVHRRLREMAYLVLHWPGLMMILSFVITGYVAMFIPARSLTDLITWNAAHLVHFSGRWIASRVMAARKDGQMTVPDWEGQMG